MQFNRILIILLLLISCKPDSELTMERGIYFYESGDYNASANQFNKIILSYQSSINTLSESDIEILAQAYQQLALHLHNSHPEGPRLFRGLLQQPPSV